MKLFIKLRNKRCLSHYTATKLLLAIEPSSGSGNHRKKQKPTKNPTAAMICGTSKDKGREGRGGGPERMDKMINAQARRRDRIPGNPVERTLGRARGSAPSLCVYFFLHVLFFSPISPLRVRLR